mgnify:CR=1 FL=1
MADHFRIIESPCRIDDRPLTDCPINPTPSLVIRAAQIPGGRLVELAAALFCFGLPVEFGFEILQVGGAVAAADGADVEFDVLG